MTVKTVALVTGITGQDAGYLAEYLLKLDYTVVGLRRRASNREHAHLDKLEGDFYLIDGDMTDGVSLTKAVKAVKPDEVYNLAAQSFVGASWDQPMLTSDVNFMGTLRLLEACREMGAACPRIYQASTSEMFGNVPARQWEKSRMIPRSPYGVSKLAAHRLCRVYRESFGMFIACGILFNHESPRRGKEFVTRKIAMGVAKIMLDKQDHIELGNITAKRDWGYAGDYVRAMWLMLQPDVEPDDYVIATGETHSVREFIVEAFRAAEGILNADETGAVKTIRWEHVKKYVKTNPDLMRPADVHELCGDPTKAREKLGWEPVYDFEKLVHLMVSSEIKKLKGV
jgi:GDPmannose 4,6-dehydratase